jgi:hypothetical protein
MKADHVIEDFRPLIGKTFEVVVGEELFPIVLRDVQPVAAPTVREGGGFTLDLTGPVSRYLRQATYEMRCEGESWFLFVVPLGPKEGVFEYQVLFN